MKCNNLWLNFYKASSLGWCKVSNQQNIVYHYCSTNTFMNIISGKSIRLSDITKSNDSMEILWITKFIKEILDEEFNKETTSTQYFKNGYPHDSFTELVEIYSEDFFKEESRLYSYLVCCFSEVGDLLSQWRGYANDATGLAIGFDTNKLSLIGKPSKDDHFSSDIFYFGKVVYDEYTQKAQIRKCAQELIKELKPLAKEPIGNIKQQSMLAFNKCFMQLFKLSIFMKNPFFKEEKEWRICHCINLNDQSETAKIHIEDGLALSNINHYSRQNDVVPYVDLAFDKSNIEVIKKIIIGPKCKAREKDIKIFLENNGIYCDVSESDGTYR